METKIDSQELGLVITFGLMKFSPKELYHKAAMMLTADNIIVFDDMIINSIESSTGIKHHKARATISLTDVGYVVDERLLGRRELKNYHRLSVTSKDGNNSLILFYPKTEAKSAKAFIDQLKEFKIEVAKGKSDISLRTKL